MKRIGDQITVDGFVLHTEDAHTGFSIEQDKFLGWYDSVDFRRDETLFAAAHGGFDSPGWLGARTLTWGGLAEAPSAQELRRKARAFAALLADGGSGRVEVQRDGEVTHALATRQLSSFQMLPGDELARWTLQLRCADPRIYGQRFVYENEPAFHYGSFPALPVIDVFGVLPAGTTINGPEGRQYEILRPIAAGEQASVDMRDGRLRINDQFVAGGVGRADTWAIPPGVQFQHTATNLAVLKVTLTDTHLAG
ncbi:hypothetical protein GRS96_12340 [Rathayibacter sp. VKM Ac-2803]|uniref:hypothetical protein n=1 Tax=Rathayibacter sp. VKM Ac-2803 TaxID=2609256 RepID=UPI0013581E96|nr:hypothetical protein [Rathayibacter sp. VKM Ac-2803]MWV50058.1 hypothetical protein [Rathayibacter sp. VKM Ac-2803]